MPRTVGKAAPLDHRAATGWYRRSRRGAPSAARRAGVKMSPTNLLWELEKLRRRMKADDQELKEAMTRLTRRSRGQEPKKLTEEITTKRKNTRTRRRTRYENKLEEY